MTLLKTSLLNGISVGIRLGSALITNKTLALFVGPTGYAAIGQFQNSLSIAMSLSGGLLATGVTKATAEHFDNEDRQHLVWQTAFRIALITSLAIAFSLLLFREWLTIEILQRQDFSSIFVWLALATPTIVTHNLLLAIINGKKEIGVYISSNIIGSLVGMILIGFFAYFFGLHGALIALTISPTITLTCTVLIIRNRGWFQSKYLWGKTNPKALKELMSYGLMGLTTALTIPVTHILIRNDLIANLGAAKAGYWQASWKISEIFLMMITTSLTLYYLPRIAEIRAAKELRIEIFKVYLFVIPLAIVGAAVIYFSRDFIISNLFTIDFLPMRELFFWQLVGDLLKANSFVLAYIMLGRTMVKSYVATEIIFGVSFFLLTSELTRRMGLVGVSIAHAINYGVYWLCLMVLVKKEIMVMNRIEINNKLQ